MITQRSGFGAGPAFGPRTKSAVDRGRGRMRLVNQPESGTSSIVLMLPRAMFDGFAGVTNRLYERS